MKTYPHKVLVLLIFIGSFFTNLSAQDWKIYVTNDNFIELHNFWNTQPITIDIQVAASKNNCLYTASLIITNDKKKGLLFPHDFVLVQGDSSSLVNNQEFKITATHKNNKLNTHKFLFNDPQSIKIESVPYSLSPTQIKLLNIKGTTIDAYQWYDLKGYNLIVRSFTNKHLIAPNDTLSKTYIYSYIFNKSQETLDWKLQQKNTDIMWFCQNNIALLMNLDKLQFTDYNQDLIAEISHQYTLSCSKNTQDTLMPKRTVVFSNGKKYAVTGTFVAKKNNTIFSYDFPLDSDSILERFAKIKANEFNN